MGGTRDWTRWRLETEVGSGSIRLPLLGLRRLTPARAVRLVAILTLLVTTSSGIAMRLIDGREFPTIGLGLWWAAQTVTTVGYGDVVPHETAGRIVALLVMFDAVGFMTVVTGAVTATLIEGARDRSRRVSSIPAQLEEISGRLGRLEAALLGPESAETRMRSQSSTPAVGMDWGGTNPGSASVAMPTRGPAMTRDTGGFADATQSSPSAG
jgi:voltage-gated potassium channel